MTGNIDQTAYTFDNAKVQALGKIAAALATIAGSLAPAATVSASTQTATAARYTFARTALAVAYGDLLDGAHLTPTDVTNTATGAALSGSWCAAGAAAAGQATLFSEVAA